MAANDIGLNAVAGGKKITGSHWQQSKSTLQKMGNQLKLLRFSPCYGIGCPIRWFPPFKWAESKGQLYHNVVAAWRM